MMTNMTSSNLYVVPFREIQKGDTVTLQSRSEPKNVSTFVVTWVGGHATIGSFHNKYEKYDWVVIKHEKPQPPIGSVVIFEVSSLKSSCVWFRRDNGRWYFLGDNGEVDQFGNEWSVLTHKPVSYTVLFEGKIRE